MLTSLVILTLNNMDQTLRCVNSIRRFTDAPYEIVVIDNGSNDGTIGWLYEQPDIKFMCNGENAGFAAASNQGAALASGDVIVLLNNDTLVSPRWLSQMHAALLSHESVGIVGPVSNFVLPMQLNTQTFAGDEDFFAFADRFNRSDAFRWRDATAISGFCMMLRRSIWNSLGGLDEQFAIGGYEDIDLCYRALKTGLTLRVAGDTYIYHEGNRSFQRNSLDPYAIAGLNRKKFLRKWGFNPERLILQLDPGFLPNVFMHAHPHHPPIPTALPGGWYGMDRSGAVYRIERGVKRGVASYADFERLRISYSRVAHAHDLLCRLPDGLPIRPLSGMLRDYPDVFHASDPNGGMHWIAYGIRYPFREEASLRTFGLRPEEAVPLALDDLHSLPEGWPIQGDVWEEHELIDHLLYSGPDGTLYYGEGQRLRPLVSEQTLGVYGWQRERAVPLPVHVLTRSPMGPPIP